ncbi:hypothetical protein BABINDRAFT_163599 [Babjeviella inositovora NRRL Y-12698]|uniref:2-(3-amino-3-carboxypropyl)histidine synthase subunit 2 n=1 Tax=Babjeviella inositovora NRRL Y-12698 TaxID=984486 RepID=A0A1E3QI75_9ASCO|nr:uncharacterized protein BABINDRAFT_163599 [Babjeviella inositovora NRRL Y-12698]ODQ77340.1 hypothetical protein BABINDRAFT_163599 [Babjeviella inositovora NRRL Y-12698]
MTEAIAPTLSTYQDVQTFEFDRFKAQERHRSYLGTDDLPSLEALKARLFDYYSMPELLAFLEEKVQYRKITLQFPDHLVSDSAIIAQEMLRALNVAVAPLGSGTDASCASASCDSSSCCKKAEGDDNSERKVWILADTSYSPCCIDEVAAEHVHSDLVIHFGDACLNNVDKLPSVYVFGKSFIDETAFTAKFQELYPDTSSKVVLMADAPHTYYLPRLYERLKKTYPHLAYAAIKLPESNTSVIIDRDAFSSAAEVGLHQVNRFFIGLKDVQQDMEQEGIDSALQGYDLLHITLPEAPRLLVLSTKFASLTIFEPTDNSINQGPFPSLMKRYRYMHMARTAGTIGILVNTLSLKNTKSLLNKVSQWIKDAGKKHYMFVVGKPNVAKLANFESIDIWCVLGCGQAGIIVDQVNEFYKPVITPYELQMALNDEVSWTGKWITDFQEVLRNAGEEKEEKDAEPAVNAEDYEDEAPEFNPVTGKYVSTSRPLRRLQHMSIEAKEPQEDDSTALIKKFSSTMAIRGTVSTSAAQLQNRLWTGLGSDFQDASVNSDEEDAEEGALVEEGRGGVARIYDK